MLDVSSNRDAQEKIKFNILKSATLVASKQLDSHGVLQIPGRIDTAFNALTRIANQGEHPRVSSFVCLNMIHVSFLQKLYIRALF